MEKMVAAERWVWGKCLSTERQEQGISRVVRILKVVRIFQNLFNWTQSVNVTVC